MEPESIDTEPAQDTIPSPSAIVIHEGDTLLVMTRGPISMATADQYRRRLLAQAPGLADVVIVEADAIGVYRPDEAAPPAYVDRILDAYLDGKPLDFQGAKVPEEVQVRLGFTLASTGAPRDE